MYYEIIPSKIFRNNSGILTYFSETELRPGHIVIVPLGHSSCVGIVIKKVKKPSFTCKTITKLLYETPLPLHLIKSALWLSSYYLSPLPSCVSLLLPIGIEKNRRQKSRSHYGTVQSKLLRTQDGIPIEPPLNSAQQKALSKLKNISNNTKLLFGITGSGKTNIYLKLAAESISQGKSVILLVPEIALTSQLVRIFESTFSRQIILMHSKQTESERHLIWQSLLNSTEPQIVIGPRSALLAPLRNLGLIIIDEAHESSYYQENPPKYSALRLASFLAGTLNITCLLGSATPLVSDYYIAKTKNSLIALTEKAKQTAIIPNIKIINFTSRESFTKNRYFSDPLIQVITSNLANDQQTLIYHNRRGSAPITICEKCGWQALCPNCLLPLTLHSDSFSLICHTCGHTEKTPISCPECHHPSILHKGFGTKLLEAELRKLFPDASIARFDADNKKTESLDALYDEVKNGNIKIIIGTQTVSRGLDLPHLASIGIVQADSGLSLPDYSAEEKTFELLTQVIGRVGRGHLDTASVVIQTYQPDSPVIQLATKSDYLNFSDYLLKKRRASHLPPFTYLAKLSVTYKTEQTTINKIRALSSKLTNKIKQMHLSSITISQPMPCFHEHTPSGYSWQLILKSTSRANLIKLLNDTDNVKISLDPPSLL
ncbi:primosomal protein N' [Candidatus Saccharibacteria bacterium]|nr:primosomal protein N' [Candidatus Saccharibacteria bacterium]